MSQPEQNIEQLWTVKDLMKALNLKRSWVYAAVERKEIPHLRLGTHVRFEPEVVRAWLKSQRQGPGATAGGNVVSLRGGGR